MAQEVSDDPRFVPPPGLDLAELRNRPGKVKRYETLAMLEADLAAGTVFDEPEFEKPMTAIAFYPRELYALREVLSTDHSRRPEYGAFFELRDLLARVESAIVACENARK